MDSSHQLGERLQHNARTPLNSILGMVEMLEGTALSDEQRQYVGVLRRATEALVSLVDVLPHNSPGEQRIAASADKLSGIRILLVDDAEDNRFLVTRYLRDTGVQLDEANDGAVALRMVQDGAYDIVLMDVEMPVMDGFTASTAIRQWERANGRSPVRIIALTAHDAAAVIQQSRAAGCDLLLTKPLRKATLIEAIQPAPADVADLVPAYVEKRRADLTTLRDAVARNDYETVRGIGHKMAGTGTGYGFPRVSALGAALERAAKAGEATTIAGLIDALELTLAS